MTAIAIADRVVGPGFENPAELAPGTSEELRRFAELQSGLAPMFSRVFPNPLAPRTVIVIPSMSLDGAELAKLTGATHYEERFLCLLMLLKLPATRVVYVTSEPVPPSVVDYYLRLTPGVDLAEARRRLTMIACGGGGPGSAAPLTERILDQPALVQQLRSHVIDPASTHLTCFNVTPLERTLAVRLGIPMYGCDPALNHLGTKSGSRTVFREAGVLVPPGFEHLRSVDDIVGALTALKREHPHTRRAVIKLEEGFSGEGNATFSYEGAPTGAALADWVRSELPRRARLVAAGESWDDYCAEFTRMGGIVEAFVDGHEVRSPSVQCRIDPLGHTQIISTHDQVLGGASGQVYLGCTFPAEPSCCSGLHAAAERVSRVLATDGVVGRFGIDFVSTLTDGGWSHYAIEINLRKGGTTHPFLTLALLTGGDYDASTGLFHTSGGQPCYYVASDNLSDPAYTELTPDLVIAAARNAGLHYDASSGSGVVFHLMGALVEFGKLGAVCIGPTREAAHDLFERTTAVLRNAAACRPNDTPLHRPAGRRPALPRDTASSPGESRPRP